MSITFIKLTYIVSPSIKIKPGINEIGNQNAGTEGRMLVLYMDAWIISGNIWSLGVITEHRTTVNPDYNLSMAPKQCNTKKFRTGLGD